MKNGAANGLDEVNRRFGRISGSLALVYIAVFVKLGLRQALTERCGGAVVRRRTIERRIRVFRENGIVRRVGVYKTGGRTCLVHFAVRKRIVKD